MDFSKIGTRDFFNEKEFVSRMGSLNTWSGTLSSLGGSVVSGGLGMMNLGKVDGFNSMQIGQIRSLNGFAGSLASTAIGYGITGNASFNLVRAKGTGLVEVNIGKDGFNMQLGMGGTDISLGRISSALAGAQHWEKNREIEKAAKRDGLGNAATALRAQYGFGDGMQRMQLESILKGDTRLARGTGTGEAETVTKDGKRTVYLNNYKDTMSREEQLAMGITLGHEAYRDGLVGSGQQQFMETARAVIGHTELALRMQSDARYTKSLDNIIAGSDILQKDIDAYKSGDMMTMLGHVAGNYDWSKDYWRVTKDKKGNILKIENDNSNDITYVDEYGNVTGKDEYRGGSRSEFLADKLGMSSKEQVREMLSNAGYTYNPNTGFFEGKNAKQAFDITGRTEMQVGAEKQGNWVIHATGEAKQFFEAGGKKVSSGLTRFGNKMGDSFDRIFKRGIYSKEYETLKSKYDSVAGLPYSANKSDWIMDKESILTADSKGFNCIGFVTYMYGIEAKYSVANFEAYSHFKKLSGITSFDKLQIGDVIRWRGTEKESGAINNHVQIYAGNGYVWESTVSSTNPSGVRFWGITSIENWYKNKTTYELDYFRPKKEEWKK